MKKITISIIINYSQIKKKRRKKKNTLKCWTQKETRISMKILIRMKIRLINNLKLLSDTIIYFLLSYLFFICLYIFISKIWLILFYF